MKEISYNKFEILRTFSEGLKLKIFSAFLAHTRAAREEAILNSFWSSTLLNIQQ